MTHKEIELFVAFYLLGIGLSHLLQARVWLELFSRLRGLGPIGSFPEGLLALALGAYVATFHNVWSGLPMLVTILGWGQILKGFVRLLAPRASLRIYEKAERNGPSKFRAGGVIAIALALFVGYIALR